DLLRRLPHDLARQPHATARVGAAAELYNVGVMGDDAHVLDRHVVPFIDELREARLMTLSLGGGADDHIDPAVRMDRHFGTLARHPGGGVEIVCHGDAAMLATGARGGAALRKADPIAGL